MITEQELKSGKSEMFSIDSYGSTETFTLTMHSDNMHFVITEANAYRQNIRNSSLDYQTIICKWQKLKQKHEQI